MGHAGSEPGVPTEVEFPIEDAKIKQIASGNSHMLALGNEGEVYAWGVGESGRLGNAGTSDEAEPETVFVLLEMGVIASKIDCGNSYSMVLGEG